MWNKTIEQTLWLSVGYKKSAGVSILKDSFKDKVLKKKSDEKGHWIFLMVEIHTHIVLLETFYGLFYWGA